MTAGQLIQWHDLCVVVDDGSIPIPRYTAMEFAMREQATQYPHGISFLVILPPEALPPAEAVKRTVKESLIRLAPSLASLSYLVEGKGFKGVAARATLVGMKIFASRPYPIYVETVMLEVLGKILPHLAGGRTITSDPRVIMNVISDARLTWIPQATRARQPGVTK